MSQVRVLPGAPFRTRQKQVLASCSRWGAWADVHARCGKWNCFLPICPPAHENPDRPSESHHTGQTPRCFAMNPNLLSGRLQSRPQPTCKAHSHANPDPATPAPPQTPRFRTSLTASPWNCRLNCCRPVVHLLRRGTPRPGVHETGCRPLLGMGGKGGAHQKSSVIPHLFLHTAPRCCANMNLWSG